MHPRARKTCLVVWGVMFFLSPMIMSPPGDLWPWFTIMALVTIAPITLVGPAWQRILGGAFLVVSSGLIVMDIRAGKLTEEKRRHRQPPAATGANKPASGNARSALQYAFLHQWPGVPEPDRWP